MHSTHVRVHRRSMHGKMHVVAFCSKPCVCNPSALISSHPRRLPVFSRTKVVDEPDGTHGLPAADGASEGVHSQARSERARVTVLPPLAGVPAAASLEAAAPTLNAPTVDGERAK